MGNYLDIRKARNYNIVQPLNNQHPEPFNSINSKNAINAINSMNLTNAINATNTQKGAEEKVA